MPHQSTRKKKALDRYSDYVLYRMTDKTHLYSRLQSLARLVRSGVLCEVDNDTAYRLVEAFCFKRYILTFLCLTCCCIFSLNYCYLCLFAFLLLLTCVVTVLSEKGEKNVKVRVHAKIWCVHDVHILILYSVESSKLTLFQTSTGFYVSAVQVF